MFSVINMNIEYVRILLKYLIVFYVVKLGKYGVDYRVRGLKGFIKEFC